MATADPKGASVFSIVELLRGDTGILAEGVRFDWNARRQSSPRSNWTWEKSLRTIRTDYEGNSTPTEQVLGTKFEEFTVTGKWDDRYNPLSSTSDGTGFAQQTLEAMEALIERANVCRFQLDDNSVVGLVKKCKIIYRRRAEIGYELTVSPHYRDRRGDARQPPAIRSKQSQQMLDEMDNAYLELAASHLKQPDDSAVNGTTVSSASDLVEGLGEALQTLRDLGTTRIIGPAGQVVDGFARTAQGFASIQSEALGLFDSIANMGADATLSYQTAMTVLNFEVWRRNLSNDSLMMSLQAAENGAEMARRARPLVRTVHRAKKGESLMAISTQYFGTPFHWRDIAKRNNISTLELTGQEAPLIIPETVVANDSGRRTSPGSRG